MSIEQVLIAVAATLSGWLTAAFGWIKWWHELREKKQERDGREKERTAKEKAQKELSEIRRRANAPFLLPNRSRFSGLYFERGGGKISWVSPMDGSLLCEFRDEVAIKPDEEQIVVFVVDNFGEAARSVTIKLDGEPVSFEREADINGAHGLQFLVYPYYRDKHGVEQKLTLTFESRTGVQDTHVYLTRHGHRILKRIDPPEPE